jgi:fatty-acyl-CoA synthase
MSRSNRRRAAEFRTIAEALDAAAGGDATLRFFSSRGELASTMSYAALRDAALAAGRALLSSGLAPGDRVAVIAETGPDFLNMFHGCQYAGLVPCPLPFMTFVGGRDAYCARIGSLMRAADAKAICTPAALESLAREAADGIGARVLSFDQLRVDGPDVAMTPSGPDELAYIQFSSGSTAAPKGVPVRQSALRANVAAILNDGVQLTDEDRAFSWLPFYHDMGLVSLSLAALFGQCPVDYIAPSSFARRPGLWIELMSRLGSTITAAPTFGYRLAAQRAAPQESADLSRLRIAGVGGDMIRTDDLEAFASAMSAKGFDAAAFRPSYGLAEATLAVAFADRLETHAPSPPDAGQPGERARRFVVCGRVISGHELIIAAPDGATVPAEEIGRILVRGPSIMEGYVHPPRDGSPLGPDGFLDTGDLGYLVEGKLVVTGRAKDVLHFRGRNIWPEDIEWTAERIPPLKAGDAAAFGVSDEGGDDRLVVLVQSGLPDEEAEALCHRVRTAVSEAAGVVCDVVTVPPRSLPLTSSGKLSRQAARLKYLGGEFGHVPSEPDR